MERIRGKWKTVSPHTQETVTRINQYLDVHQLLRKTAKDLYTRRKHEGNRDTLSATARGLENIYLRRQKNPDLLESDTPHWPGGNEEDRFRQTLTLLAPEIERLEQAHRPENVTRRDVFKTIFRTASALPKLTPEQQEHVLGMGGLNREDMIRGAKKIALSATIAAVLTPVVDSIIAGSIVAGASAPFLHLLSNVPSPLAVALSYVAQYGSLLVDAVQNMRLMKDDRYQVTPNVFATSGGYATKAILPGNQKAQDAIVGVGTLLPALLQESVLLPLLATPFGPALVAARNFAAALFINTPLVGVSEFFLRRKPANTNRLVKK